MAIFVDDAMIQWRGQRWCHLMTDGPFEELHAFAEEMGLKRTWFQDTRHPHYDVTEHKRHQAIHLGAVSVSATSRETLVLLRLIAQRKRATGPAATEGRGEGA